MPYSGRWLPAGEEGARLGPEETSDAALRRDRAGSSSCLRSDGGFARRRARFASVTIRRRPTPVCWRDFANAFRMCRRWSGSGCSTIHRSISLCLSAVPRDRAALAIEAMRRGKDVMVDKPGVTTPDQLAAVEAAVRETGRIWSIALGRLTSPSVQAALGVARSGELGRLVSPDQPGAAPAEPGAAAGLVLRSRGVWRDYHRYRRALDRPVSGLRGCVRRRRSPPARSAALARSRLASKTSPRSPCTAAG